MKVAILDDYQDVFRTLKCYPRLKGHEVAVYHDSVKEPAKLAERLNGAHAVILLQQDHGMRAVQPLRQLRRLLHGIVINGDFVALQPGKALERAEHVLVVVEDCDLH